MNAGQRQATHDAPAGGGRPDLVYGVGKTGLSIARYIRRNQGKAIFVDTRKAPPGIDELAGVWPGAEVVLGSVPPGLLDRVSRVIVSPGISDNDELLQKARAGGIDVVSDIELFVDNAAAPFVAVTGSNGKSTVTTLLALMCKAAGKSALAGANLGEPALDLLAEATPDIYILELSSFQLQRTRALPATVAVLLNISVDHLDWHRDEDEYRRAKYRIFREAAAIVWNRDDAGSKAHLKAGQEAISFGYDAPDAGQYGLVGDGGDICLARGAETLLATSELRLVGVHNQANALAALAAGELVGLDLEPMLQVLREFAGLPHRMQFAGTSGGARYINDSKATNVAAAIASVNSVDTPVVLIAGGQGKGGDFQALADSICDRLRAAVVIGEDAPAIALALTGRVPVQHAASMTDAVQQAARLAQPGDTVLLAPACASFDQFANYMQRGTLFCEAVGALPA